LRNDESYVTAVVGLKLQQAGYEVVVANNGEEAYQIACSQPLNMIVTTFRCPFSAAWNWANCSSPSQDGRHTGDNVNVTRASAYPIDLAQTTIKRLHEKPFSVRELIRRVTELATSPKRTSIQ